MRVIETALFLAVTLAYLAIGVFFALEVDRRTHFTHDIGDGDLVLLVLIWPLALPASLLSMLIGRLRKLYR